MVLWHVKLFDKVLVTVTSEVTARAMVNLLNNGSLHGVPGHPAAYEDARAGAAPTETKAFLEAQSDGTSEPEVEMWSENEEDSSGR